VSTIAITDRVLRVASGGVKLRVREWLPRGPEKGQVLLLHGLGDHSARHDWAASLFTDAGYRAVGFDWPGNGESDGVRGDMPTVAESGRLIEEVIEALDLRPCGIFAHSTGAFLVLHWLGGLAQPLERLRWVWISSPLLVPSHGQPRLKISIARLLAARLPRLTLTTGVKPSRCYHTGFDPRIDEALKKDGSHHRVSLRFATNLLATERDLLATASRIPGEPAFLVTQGTEDDVCPPHYVEDLFAALPGSEKCLIFASGARHEPFREKDHRAITNAVRSWLDER
jgi:alpha-beta hydrolase superfamily lysophospholipase